MARPPFKPTDEQRNLVKELAAVGAPHKLIARKSGNPFTQDASKAFS